MMNSDITINYRRNVFAQYCSLNDGINSSQVVLSVPVILSIFGITWSTQIMACSTDPTIRSIFIVNFS